MTVLRPCICADFNGTMDSPRDPSRSMVPLDTMGSLRDLTNAGMRLREGLKLVIHMDSDENEDIEADATAYFDLECAWWYAELEGEIRYVPAYGRSVAQFLCLGCRTDLGATIKNEHCPTCGTSFRAAIAPP